MTRPYDWLIGAGALLMAGAGFFAAFGAIFAVSHMAINTIKAVL